MCVRSCLRQFIPFVLQFALATSDLSFDLSQASAQHILSAPTARAPSAYEWTGFYIGGHFGYSAHPIYDISSINTVSGSTGVGTPAYAGGWFGGGQVGYNWMVAPHFLVGIEGDISDANLVRGQSTSPTFAANGSVKMLATIRGRAGFVFNNNVLLYGTGGAAFEGTDSIRYNFVAINNAPAGSVENYRSYYSGWVAGAGAEWSIAPRWTAKLEYLYLKFPPHSSVSPLSLIMTTFTSDQRTLKIGVNYHFGAR